MATKQTKKEIKCTTGCSPRQKLLGILALTGLFVCGLMVGLSINTKRGVDNAATENVQIAQGPSDESSRPDAQETCELIENMLEQQLAPEDALDTVVHTYNIKIYEQLVKYGCPENTEKYNALIVRENDILSALSGSGQQTCQEIESLLSQQMPWGGANSADRITRAKIYANMSERGCPENSAKYVEMAKQELQIARALEDDQFNKDETIEVVETYKRLNMQAAAEEIFNKVKKLTNPAIDFIIEAEKIINE